MSKALWTNKSEHLSGSNIHWVGPESGARNYFGTLGEAPISGAGPILTDDRDYSGSLVETHSSQYFTALSPPGARMQFQTAK
jgi:hypothetical protein